MFCNYVITAALFALMAIWTNPLTILLGVILLGGRQLGFGVIVHECGQQQFSTAGWLSLQQLLQILGDVLLALPDLSTDPPGWIEVCEVCLAAASHAGAYTENCIRIAGATDGVEEAAIEDLHSEMHSEVYVSTTLKSRALTSEDVLIILHA